MDNPNTICILPWVSVETSPIGTVRPCCLAIDEITKPNGSKFDLNNDTLEEAYKSEYMQQLRQQFRSGEKPSTCQRCWDEEAAGRLSKRLNSKVRLKHIAESIDYNNDQPNQLWFVDLKLGNICNLKCRICGSWSSSKWAEEEIGYVKELKTQSEKKTHLAYTFLKQGAWPRKTEAFWDNMRELLPNIKYLEFTGGEPFMIQEHFDLLKFAVDNGYAKDIEIHYNTNGTIYPDWAEDIWANFKLVEIAFSIDNVGKRFEYERYGAKWDEVQENIKKFESLKNKTHNIITQLCLTINIQNVFYLDELLSWAETKHFNNIFFNMLHEPSVMCITNLTEQAKQLVVTKLSTVEFSPKFKLEIMRVIKFINNGWGSSGYAFLNKMKITDEYRNQSFYDSHPEIAVAMGYTDEK